MKVIRTKDSLQPGYEYELSESEGKKFDPEFKPDLSPKEMLALGAFGGDYFEGEQQEFPKDWFVHAKLSTAHDKKQNQFGVDASQSREVWQQKGWMYKDDPRGWFQWYCRYYFGRRIPEEDARQRQALLHWAYDSTRL